MKYLTLRHATPARCVRSILRAGLDPAFSQTSRPEVWLHAPSKTPWAILHVCQRHQVGPEAVVVLTVKVPRSLLRRRKKSLWSSDALIPRGRIVSVAPVAVYADPA